MNIKSIKAVNINSHSFHTSMLLCCFHILIEIQLGQHTYTANAGCTSKRMEKRAEKKERERERLCVCVVDFRWIFLVSRLLVDETQINVFVSKYNSIKLIAHYGLQRQCYECLHGMNGKVGVKQTKHRARQRILSNFPFLSFSLLFPCSYTHTHRPTNIIHFFACSHNDVMSSFKIAFHLICVHKKDLCIYDQIKR